MPGAVAQNCKRHIQNAEITGDLPRHSLVFLDQTRVTVDPDPSSPALSTSLSLVRALNLPRIFVETGHRTCSATITAPTIGVSFRSQPLIFRDNWSSAKFPGHANVGIRSVC